VFKQVQINIPFLDAIQHAFICRISERFGHHQEKDKCSQEIFPY